MERAPFAGRLLRQPGRLTHALGQGAGLPPSAPGRVPPHHLWATMHNANSAINFMGIMRLRQLPSFVKHRHAKTQTPIRNSTTGIVDLNLVLYR